jgi:predicted phosphoribosyltransferase
MLATRAALRRLHAPIVISLPRGAVEVAVEVAAVLGAPIGVLPVVEISTPGKPEYVVGAVTENSIHVIDRSALAALGVDESNLALRVAEATAEIARLSKIYRGDVSPVRTVADHTVVVVDDGLATVPALGAVALALTKLGANRVLLATPVEPEAKPHAFDDFISVHSHDELDAIGLWYDQQNAPSHETAAALLAERSGARKFAAHPDLS